MTHGADAALPAFVEGRRTALFRSAYLLCGHREEAAYLVQTTLVKVVLGARRHRRLDNLDAYARKILVNAFIHRRAPALLAARAGVGDVPDVPGRSVDRDTGVMVRAALARLGPKAAGGAGPAPRCGGTRMSQDDVHGTPWATELLGRALQASRCRPGPRYGRGVRVGGRARWRRRGAVTGAAAAMVVVSLAGTGVLPWNGRESTVSPGLRPTSRAAGRRRCCRGVGTIREYGHIAGAGGPYDGFYAVYRDGGVGYLNIQVLPGRREDASVPVGERCSSCVPGTAATCVSETLANGDERESAELTRESSGGGTTWSPSVPCGSSPLDAPPLTADQLRGVVMVPELLP